MFTVKRGGSMLIIGYAPNIYRSKMLKKLSIKWVLKLIENGGYFLKVINYQKIYQPHQTLFIEKSGLVGTIGWVLNNFYLFMF